MRQDFYFSYVLFPLLTIPPPESLKSHAADMFPVPLPYALFLYIFTA